MTIRPVAWLVVVWVSGCTVQVPDPDLARFACNDNRDCAGGYACVGQVCVKEGAGTNPGGDNGPGSCSNCYFPNECNGSACVPDPDACTDANRTGSCREPGLVCKDGSCFYAASGCDPTGANVCGDGYCKGTAQCPDGSPCALGTSDCPAKAVCRIVASCAQCSPSCAVWQSCTSNGCTTLSPLPAAESCAPPATCPNARPQCNASRVCEQTGCGDCPFGQTCHNGGCVYDPRACSTINDHGYCPAGTTCVTSGIVTNCQAACIPRTFVAADGAAYSDCYYPCSDDSQCTGAACVFDPGISTIQKVCRMHCSADTDCAAAGLNGMVCRYVSTADSASGWRPGGTTIRACVESNERDCSMDGARPAWFAAQEAADTCTLPCSVADLGKETLLKTLSPGSIKDLSLKNGVAAFTNVNGTSSSVDLQPLVHSGGPCTNLALASGNLSRAKLVYDTTSNAYLAYLCNAPAAGSFCRTSAAAGNWYVLTDRLTTEASGCFSVASSSSVSAVALPPAGVIDFAASDAGAVVSVHRGNSPFSYFLTTLVPAPNPTANDLALSSMGYTQLAEGKLGVSRDLVFYTRLNTGLSFPNNRLFRTTVNRSTPAVVMDPSPAPATICNIAATRDRVVWTQLAPGGTCIAVGDQHDVYVAEAPDFSDVQLIGTTPSGSTEPVIMAASGSVVLWAVRDASGSFELRALDRTNCDMQMNPTIRSYVTIASRQATPSGYCPNNATAPNTYWVLKDFAIQSDERGGLTLAYAAECHSGGSATGPIQGTYVFGRRLFP
ncbi:MAG: hypothetical protein HY903_25275 [Deltaproteobacteria bacterium]|nr:hypothetical protein [Deltaproteobacteria bacterium]